MQAAIRVDRTSLSLAEFSLARNLDVVVLHESLRHLDALRLVRSGADTIALSASSWDFIRGAIIAALAREHERQPDMIGVSRERLRRLIRHDMHAAVFDAALEALVGESAVMVSGVWLHLPDHRPQLNASEEKLWQTLVPLLDAQPFQPPRVRDLARDLSVDEGLVRQTLKRVAMLGKTYPVAHDHYFTAAAVEGLAGYIRDIQEREGCVTAARFRDAIGGGRKLAIHILEFFDRVGYTRRVKDTHLLRNPELFRASSM